MKRRAFIQLAGVVSCAPAAAVPEADIVRVAARLRDAYANTADNASEFSVDELLATLAPDGHWPDIDIKHPPPSQEGVGRYLHHLRLWKLAAAWKRTSDPARRATLAEALHRAFPLWLDRPAPPSIPWFRQIGTPQAIARATLIFAGELKPTEIQSAIGIMRTCVRPDGVLDYTGTPATGQNLQHEAEIQIIAACLAGDAESLARYAAAIKKEINVRDVEGLQCDWSFHQHGPQLYSGALYGTGFARDGAKLATALHQIVPGLLPENIDTWKLVGPRVLANDSVQAIAHDGLVQAVFWSAGELPLADGRTIGISRPGLVQLRRDPVKNRWTLAAGNPTHREGPLRISIRAAESAIAVQHAFDFPAGGYAGRPQTKNL